MKLLIQADDYGITRAVSSGIVFGIHHGLVRNTGIFTNMDWTEECLDMIKPYLDQIDLGIDHIPTIGTSWGKNKVLGV